MALEELQSLLDEVADIHSLALAVRNRIANVHVLALENIEDGQNLAVVRYQRLTDELAGDYKLLQHFECDGDYGWIPRVERGFERDDELGNDGQDLLAAVLKHIKHALDRQETVGFFLLSQAIEEYG